jgi:hypothetical protein
VSVLCLCVCASSCEGCACVDGYVRYVCVCIWYVVNVSVLCLCVCAGSCEGCACVDGYVRYGVFVFDMLYFLCNVTVLCLCVRARRMCVR